MQTHNSHLSITLSMMQSAIKHGSISCQTIPDLLGHRADQLMTASVHSTGFENLLWPSLETVPTVLQQPQLWLSPAPNMLLGVEFRAVSRPWTKQCNVCWHKASSQEGFSNFSPSSTIVKDVFPGNTFCNQSANSFLTRLEQAVNRQPGFRLGDLFKSTFFLGKQLKNYVRKTTKKSDRKCGED